VWSSSLRTRTVGTPLSNAMASQKQHAVSNNTASHSAMVELMGVWDQYGTMISSSRSRSKSSSHDAITHISKLGRGLVRLKKERREARAQYILPIHHWPRTQKTPFVDHRRSLSRRCFLCEAVRPLPEPHFGDISRA